MAILRRDVLEKLLESESIFIDWGDHKSSLQKAQIYG
jgi:hypothetical protein